MNVKTLIGSVLLCSVTLGVARIGWPQETEPGQPDMDMEKVMMMAQPGPEHEELGQLTGEWEGALSFQFMPGAAPIEASTVTSARSLLGGRFVEIDSVGDIVGQEVENRMILGFDRRFEEFSLIGLDNLGTYWISAKGKRGEDGIIRLHGVDEDLIGNTVFTYELEIVGPDEFRYVIVYDEMGGQKQDPPLALVTARFTRKQD